MKKWYLSYVYKTTNGDQAYGSLTARSKGYPDVDELMKYVELEGSGKESGIVFLSCFKISE